MSGDLIRPGFFYPTYLEPEARHVHRHVNAFAKENPVLVCQKRKGEWSGLRPEVVRKSPLREVAKGLAKLRGRIWQTGPVESKMLVQAFARARLVHVFSGSAALNRIPALRRANVPFMVSFHGSDVAGEFASQAAAPARATLFDLATLVACRSEELAVAVQALGCPPEKIRTLRAVLPPAIAGKPREAPPAGTMRFLLAGRLVAKKGHETALRAFALHTAKFPDARLAFAGTGPLGDTLRASANALGIGGRVEFLGFLDEGCMREQWLACDVCLQPSEIVGGDREGVPNSLLEAMSAAVPCIATRHGGIAEVVDDGSSGLLIPEKDPAGLAMAMARLSSDPELYRSLSSGALNRFHSDFAPEIQIARIAALYREVLELGNAKGPHLEVEPQ